MAVDNKESFHDPGLPRQSPPCLVPLYKHLKLLPHTKYINQIHLRTLRESDLSSYRLISLCPPRAALIVELASLSVVDMSYSKVAVNTSPI